MAYQIPGKNAELDALVKDKIVSELARIERNRDRRNAREKQKGKLNAGSPSAAGSPGGPSDAEAAGAAEGSTADNTPQKGRGRNKDGTARKCANCGQVGHIKTNRKSVYTFRCPICSTAVKVHPGGIVLPENDNDDQERGGHDSASAVSSGGSRLKSAATSPTKSFAHESFSAFRL